MKTLQYYIARFSTMNCNKQRGMTAPHKAMMLVAVMEEVAEGRITNGFVPHNKKMEEAFVRVWKKHVGTSVVFRPSFHNPFFHLSNEPFWKLMKSDEYFFAEKYTLPQLRKAFYGARIEDELFSFMEETQTRQILIKTLLEKFIPNWKPESDDTTKAAECPVSFNAGKKEWIVDKAAA